MKIKEMTSKNYTQIVLAILILVVYALPLLGISMIASSAYCFVHGSDPEIPCSVLSINEYIIWGILAVVFYPLQKDLKRVFPNGKIGA